MLIYILKTKHHYFVCNTSSPGHGILRLQNAHPSEFPPFYQQAIGISVLCFVLISFKFSFKFRKPFLYLSEIPCVYDQYDENMFAMGITSTANIHNPL